jgi:tripartite-type tricarboxylate transporter receptor subunit TctC
MLIPRFVSWMFTVGMTVFAAGVVSGQSYPDKPIRIYAPQAGTSVDFVLRLVAETVTASLGQRMIVENRGIIGVEIVAKAPPDGYSLINYTNPLWLMPLLRDNVSWDPVKDFSPISLTVSTPTVLVVHPSLPVKSVKELIALAKARPGELNYGSTSTGNANHIAAELFKSMAGVNIVRVPYKGGAQAVNDLVAGQVHLMFNSAGVAMPYVRSGRLRALAVATAEPSALTTGLPTVAAAGLPGYESTASTGLFAPARTPAAIINRLNREFVRTLQRAEVKERLFNAAIEVVASSPEQLAATIKSEMATIGKVVKDAGLREKG